MEDDGEAMAPEAQAAAPAGAPQKRSAPPAAPVAPDAFVLMEDALEKLKILNYEKHFCEATDHKPLMRTQFAMPSQNPAANFPLFAALVQWLMASQGHFTEQWDLKFTDPNVTVTNMMAELRKVGISTDVPPHKLKQGHGSEVCQVLINLVDLTLQKKGFQFERPRHIHTKYEDEEAPDDVVGGGGPMDQGDEMVDEAVEEEESEEEMFMAEGGGSGAGGGDADDHDASMMESKVDPVAWKMELERVAPQLKVVLSSNSKEWRSHLDMASNLDKEIAADLPQMKEALSRIMEEVAEAVEKISSREKIINQNFDNLVGEYRKVHEGLHQKQEDYDKNSGSISSLTNELATISEELDNVKSQMDNRGSTMLDTSPLVDIKKAMTRIKAEIKQMELQIGSVEHTLLQLAKTAGKGGAA